MPRNGTGTYTLPRPPFVPGTVISSADVNADLSDIATALTGSLAANGETTATGQQRGVVSTTPAWSFGGDTDTGFGSEIANQAYVRAGGVKTLTVTSTGIVVTGITTGVIPIGGTMDFAGTTAPSGWLLCFGQAISRTTYAALFAVLGTSYGAGDGSTTFNLPDCRGRVRAGKDNMGGVSADRLTATLSGGVNGDNLAAVGGAEGHIITNAQMANTSVTVNIADPTHPHPFLWETDDGNSGYQGGGTFTARRYGTGTTTYAAGTAVQAAATGISATATVNGSNASHNNVQPTIIFNTIIFTGIA